MTAASAGTETTNSDPAPAPALVAVIVPEAGCGGRSAFVKLGARTHLVISIAMVAAALRLERGRIAEARLAVALAGGHSLQSAAQLLQVSPETVRFHLKNLFRKLGVNRQQDLVRMLLELSTIGSASIAPTTPATAPATGKAIQKLTPCRVRIAAV